MTRFLKRTGLLLGLILALGGYPVYRWMGPQALYAALIAISMTSLNAVVGYYYIDKYFSASFNDFMKAVFGSMGIRLLVMAVVIVLILALTKIHQISFTVSLFISYILFSVNEIIFINKKASKPDSPSR